MYLSTVPCLPIEIVEVILRLSLRINGSSEDDGHPQTLSRDNSSALTPSQKPGLPIHIRHAAAISLLSRRYCHLFQPYLYRHVTFSNIFSLRLFARTLSSRPDLSTQVRSLVILTDTQEDLSVSDAPDQSSCSATMLQSAASEILSACPNLTHLLLNCHQVDYLSAALYNLLRPKEVSLVNVLKDDDLNGILTRHRDLTAAALQNDPRIRSILFSSIAAHSEQPSSSNEALSSIAPQAERSLSHLHLVHFNGRLLHRLATLSSLTHLVLTYPQVPERRPGAPGLSVIPRSHLMLLLGSGNIARIVIRADLATCIRIMEEIAPIEDRNLVFRPIRPDSDALFTGAALESTRIAQLGAEAAALYDSIALNKLDLLAEFYNRVRRDARRIECSTTSATDADSSRGSTGRSQGRSSDSSCASTGQSVSSACADSEDGEAGQHLPPQHEPELDALSDDYDSGDEPAFGNGPHSHLEPALPTVNTNAPPLNIPIEELLRSERFGPVELARQQSTSSPPSRGTEQTSHTPPHMYQGQRRRRPRFTSRQTPFSLRVADLAGATLENIELCTQLYHALVGQAGPRGGVSSSALSEMSFW